MTLLPLDASYEEEFTKELAGIKADIKDADKFMRGIEWQICKNPSGGEKLIGSKKVWSKPFADLPDQSPVVVYYTYDEDVVYFLSIHSFDYEPELTLL